MCLTEGRERIKGKGNKVQDRIQKKDVGLKQPGTKVRLRIKHLQLRVC